ncbi:hypothetical protein AB0N65_04360 [Paenarthrobacter sp. NPDC089322]|uniref:DUF7847 domain-containing protein n=1 Tax=Paenarthrobacter sp. NPDC089322 TaxID=3155065 RepID=UPI003436F7B4
MSQPEHGQQPYPGSQPGWGGQPQWGGQPGWPAGQGGGQFWQGQPTPGWPGNPVYGQPLYVAPPKPGIIPLRPLQFGEILDGSFQTIRRNAASMFGSALIVQAIAAALLGIVTVAMLQVAESLETVETTAEFDEFLGPFIAIVAGALGVSLLVGFLGAVLQGVMVVPVSRSVLNRRTGFKQMWKLAAGRIPALLGVAALLTFAGLLAVAAVVGIAVLLFTAMGPVALVIVFPLGLGGVVVFLWIGLKLMFAPAAIVVERLGVYDGLLRSWHLTKNNWWRIFGITLVVSLMVGIIAQIVQIPVSLAATAIGAVVTPHPDPETITSTMVVTTVISMVIGALVGSVTFAFQTSVSALIYMDLRMRRDGLDVEFMRLMETGADPEGIPGSQAPAQGNTWPPSAGHAPGTPPGSWPTA